VHIRRADEGELIFIRDGEDDAPVSVLKDVGEAVCEELRHDDVAALDQSDRSGGAHGRAIPHELIDPGSGGIDYGTGADGKGLLRGGHSCEPVIAFESEALA